MLYYTDILWLKKFFRQALKIGVIMILLALLTYSCDWDFPLRIMFLPETDADYQEEVIQTPSQEQIVGYGQALGLEIVAQVQITGTLLGANSDVLRGNCPFQSDRIKLYNDYFRAVILSIKGARQDFAVTAYSRLIKQLLEKLSDDESFLQEKIRHKITLIGYMLKLREYSDVHLNHVIITRIILDGKIYE